MSFVAVPARVPMVTTVFSMSGWYATAQGGGDGDRRWRRRSRLDAGGTNAECDAGRRIVVVSYRRRHRLRGGEAGRGTAAARGAGYGHGEGLARALVQSCPPVV